ncbi:MAG: PAS domain S-box protein, partial [Bacteroidota bacterium]|nr:PAS domain S-box protein [Bacteroidota bacterium]
KLSTAVKQSPSVIAITDTKGNLEYVNPKFTELTGYTFEEAKGKNPRVLKSGEQPDEMYKELWETVSRGKEWRGEFHNKKKNGELFWEMASVSPIFNEKGKIINYIKVAEDITEKKRNEQIQNIVLKISNWGALSDKPKEFILMVRNELGAIIDTSNFYVAMYDEESDTFSLPFYTDKEDKVDSFPAGKSFTAYVARTKKPLLARKSLVGKLIKSGEVEMLGSPSEIWLGVPLFRKEKVSGVIVVQSYDDENAYDKADMRTLEIISHQISISLERKRAEQELTLALEQARQSDRLKSAFLTNMSHEIRTPMNSILGFTSLLNESDQTGEEKEEYVKIIEMSGMRLLDTINDIIDISKIESGQIVVVNTEISVNKILEDQYAIFNKEAQKRGLELKYQSTLSDNEARVVTDKNKLEGILTNLIKNALKFTEHGSIAFSCTLKTNKDNQELEFYVKDTGIGIPADRIEAVFNRFEKADIEDKEVYEGSGLGLAISKSYVEVLGGKLIVSSKEGSGSTFTFSIPYTKKSLNEDGAKQNKESGVSLKNLSVIVAEDDNNSKMFLESILKNRFAKIIYTTTGKETINKCRENPDTDIILMDIKMPDINGYDATREIRKFNPDVIIIVQTACGLEGDKEKAIEAGGDDYIAKPIKKEALLEMIQVCLDKKSI